MAVALHADGYGDILMNGLKNLQESGIFCDLTLIAENEPIKVHKAVLSAGSDYFKVLLTIDMKEKKQDEITLKGVPLRGLRKVIEFAYSGDLHCTHENINDVLIAATHLQFPEAIKLCSQFLTDLTNLFNCVDMYNLGEQFNLVPLSERSLDIILQHFEFLTRSDDFLRFNARFLGKVLEDDRLRVMSELRLFDLILRWINRDKNDREKYLPELMSKVRFPLIPPHDLVEVVMNEPMIKVDPQCLELILEANKYHMLPARQPHMQNVRTRVRSDTPSIIMLDIDDEGPRVFDLSTRSWGSLCYSHIETFHAQLCVVDNYMYVCGGIELYSSNNPVSSKCYRYDPRFDKWCEISSMQEPRHHFSLASVCKSMYAIGGYCGGVFKNVVEQYLIEEDQWVPRNAMEVRLSAAASAVHNEKIYVAGGQGDKGISRCLWCYNTVTDTWQGRAALLQGRMDHALSCYQDKLYLFGGYDKNIIKAFDVNTVECYDIETDQWTVVFENAPLISGIYSCVIGTLVYMVGGFTYDENKKRNEVWCYNVQKNEWQVVTKLHTPAMSVPCCSLYLPRHMLQDITV